MIVRYELGDRVFLANDYGGESHRIVGLRKHGVVLENLRGERRFAGKHQIEPTPGAMQKATKHCGGET